MNWTSRLVSFFFSVFFFVQSTPLFGSPFPFEQPIQPVRKVQTVAFRGASNRAPENTVAAIERSIDDSTEWVSVDVRRTRDGHHILFADETLDDKTSGSGLVHEKTLDELLSLDAGSKFARRFSDQRIPTLSTILELAKGRINLCLRCRDVEPVSLVQEILKAKMEKQIAISGDDKTHASIRDVQTAFKSASLPFVGSWQPSTPITTWNQELPTSVVQIRSADVSSEVCEAFHQKGLKVLSSTVGSDDRAEVWDRLTHCGVDWIETSNPEEVISRVIRASLKRMPIKIAHHRGASQYAPENTIAALKKSNSLEADFVEFDVRTTSDNVLVLLHDGQLDRTTTGTGPVKVKTLEELKSLDAGAWFGRSYVGEKIPTLDQFLDQFGEKMGLYFDAKDITPEALVDVLKRHNMTDRACVYQSASYLERLKTIAPEIRRMPSLGNAADIDAIANKVKPFAFDAKWSILSKQMIDDCHKKGIKVYSDALGPNESIEKYQQAIREGIDVIQTDFPLRVLRAIELLETTR
ncbi:MAG: glycerophosphodiester phosphodiesterase family protein [Planctomycetes bacterium]|nr:glycerophosphodiester phosphodiesterase family protein [Planctomycetota bacterium]